MSQDLKGRVLEALRKVMDPEIGRDIVSLDMVKGVEAKGGGVVVSVELTSPACPLREVIERDVKAAVASVEGAGPAEVRFTAAVRSRPAAAANAVRLGGIRNVIAVASGKGGVGKSTVAANLALALRAEGARVALMDADVYGPSQPLMFGLKGQQPRVTADDKILPLEAQGIEVISMGLLVEEGRSVIWRGPMIHKALAQFFEDVLWSETDYLVVDLPPGTGDAQLSLCQLVPISGAVMVTTPQEMSLIDVRKGLDMFRRVNVPILGIVENMSGFACPCCRTVTPIFDAGGGERAAREWGVPFLGGVPIDPKVRVSGDGGLPVVLSDPESEGAQAFRRIARRVACRASVEAVTGGPAAPVQVTTNRGGFEV